MQFDFSNRSILVTGAAGSIGKGIAAAFGASGASVYVTDLYPDKVQAVVEELAAKGGSCQGLSADVTRADQVTRVVQTAADAFGGQVDILVNVAGIVAQGRIEQISEQAWDDVFAVNCKGSFFFIREVVPLMKTNGYGRIINFSSKSGKTGSALMSHYSAAKAAIIGLTQSLAYELAADGINTNCLCPGIVEDTGVWDFVSAGYTKKLGLPREEIIERFTAKVPLARLARIEDIVAVTLFLASPGGDYMTGQAINVTGGREMH